MRILKVSSPTRIDLAGGTLDMWPLFTFVGGAQTINFAIDLFTSVEIEETADVFELISDDLKWRQTYSSLKDLMSDTQSHSRLYQLVLSQFPIQGPFKITTSSKTPIGSGLGSSSSLIISMLKSLYQWHELSEPAPHQFVHLAHNLEAALLGTPTGTQDYYPALSGGLNLLQYSFSHLHQEVLDATEIFEKRMFLVYTGKPHHSGLNNFEVLKKCLERDQGVLRSLYKIKEIAEEIAQVCRDGKWEHLAELFREEYKARLGLSASFASREIEELQKMTLEAGAQALKICGAGGGGCVMVWSEEKERERLKQVCQNAGYQVLSVKPVPPRQSNLY